MYNLHEQLTRGGSRIPRRRGRQLSGGWGAPTYEIAKFSEKLHKIEKISGRRGGAPPAPPKSADAHCCSLNSYVCIFRQQEL